MVKLLGVLDIIAGLIFLGSYFRVEVPRNMVIFFGLYLILKAIFFLIGSFDILSFIDISAGISLIFSFFFSLPSLILIIFAILLSIKGFISIFS